jgi:hypothetical protein
MSNIERIDRCSARSAALTAATDLSQRSAGVARKQARWAAFRPHRDAAASARAGAGTCRRKDLRARESVAVDSVVAPPSRAASKASRLMPKGTGSDYLRRFSARRPCEKLITYQN